MDGVTIRGEGGSDYRVRRRLGLYNGLGHVDKALAAAEFGVRVRAT